VDELLKAMQAQKVLLVMDGFERACAAYSSMSAAIKAMRTKPDDNQLDVSMSTPNVFEAFALCRIVDQSIDDHTPGAATVKPRGEFMLGCREED